MTENELSYIIIGAAIEVHRELGPGLLEAIYEEALFIELTEEQGLRVERQKVLPVIYKDRVLEKSYRADLVVADKIIVEIKSVEEISKIFKKITGNYIRLQNMKLGLIINFNEVLLKDGIIRIVNGADDLK